MYNYAQLLPFAAYQAEFIKSIICGRANLPSYTEMEEEVQRKFAQHLESGQPPMAFHLLDYKTPEHVAELEKVGRLKPYSKGILDLNVRLLDLIFQDQAYITMRKTTILERLDDDTFIERKLENE